ncbi:MAG: hypothetical protein ACODAE_04905, partial [Gemmatimonadota bacterium]
MTVRQFLRTFLALPVAITPAIVVSPADGSAPSESPPSPATVPDTARHALEAGRFWHASRMLHDHLAASGDSTPEAVLMTARADVGWGGWSRVAPLLEGRDWLDTAADGEGWRLLGRARFALGDAESAARALGRYLRVAEGASERERGVVEYRRAVALRRAEADSAAVEAFDRAARALPLVADRIEARAIEVLAELGDTAAVARRLVALEPGLAERVGWRSRVRAFRRADDPEMAAHVAGRAETTARGADRAEAAFELGRIGLERGDTAAARAAFRRAIDAAPDAIAAVDA